MALASIHSIDCIAAMLLLLVSVVHEVDLGSGGFAQLQQAFPLVALSTIIFQGDLGNRTI